MEGTSFVQQLAERLGSSASVRTIYGEPIEAQGKTIIPVARVAYGFGGGVGQAPDTTEAGEQRPPRGGSGSGGGGGVSISPIGVIEVTPVSTTFVPTHQTLKLLAAAGGGVAFGLLLARILAGRR